MEIKQIVIASTFKLIADRDDMEALKLALNYTYHHQNNHIPEHLQGVTSRLMDTVDDALRKDDDIQQRVRSNP